MIYSYDKVYLRIAQRVLGEMLNYAVYDCGYELNEYYRLFTESSYSEPLPAVLPFPEPCPRPLLKLSLCLEPSAGLKLDNSIPNTSLSDYASSTLIK